MGKMADEFNSYRQRMNDKILAADNKVMKRIYSIDTLTYQEGALSAKVKEMLGLATSMVLRCDDCIKYHLGKCHELGVTTAEVFEIFSVANLVGGPSSFPTRDVRSNTGRSFAHQLKADPPCRNSITF